MKKGIIVLMLSLLIQPFDGRSMDETSFLKIAIDGMAVNDALFSLTAADRYPKVASYKEKIEKLLIQLEQANIGFRKDNYPVEMQVTQGNKDKIGIIANNLFQALNEIRVYAIAAEKQFEIKDFPLILTLKSENPGDYYLGINPDFKYSLYDHPYRKSLENIQLQDIEFEEVMANSDTSLWHIGVHCPNLKVITAFGASINDQTLSKMNLHEVKNLTVLELSENMISNLPANFNANNSLIYLSLRRNKLKFLPANIAAWTNLKYINLGSNQFESEERERIQKALPKTKIIF